jgi:hypothetical protein
MSHQETRKSDRKFDGTGASSSSLICEGVTHAVSSLDADRASADRACRE